jgi:hypothetical protein
MNVSSAIAALNVPAIPAESSKPTSKADDDHAAKQKEDDFEREVRKEIERKKALADAAPLPHHMQPWQHNDYKPPADEEAKVEAAAALAQNGRNVAGANIANQLMNSRVASGAKPKGKSQIVIEEPLVPALKVEPREVAPTPIQVMVEPGLPPVQPVVLKQGEPLSLVQFPQAVAGTARQMVKDGQAVTQLDFEITPPHVGPINLSVSLQERVVSIQIIVPTLQAKQMLESQVGAISSILQSQNLTPGQVRIVTAASGKSGAGSTGQQAEQGGFGLLNGGRRRPSNPDEMNGGSV